MNNNFDIKILIIDDDPINIKLMSNILSDQYQIVTATNGIDAFNLLNQHTDIKLILLDIVIPVINGYEICRKIKNNEKTRDIPVIFVSSLDSEEDESKGLEIGAVDYITKPFSLPIVRARVRTQINLKKKTELLEKLVLIDSLTDIHNRRRFDEVLEIEWRRAARNQLNFSLLMADVDNFKLFNDNYGHGAGDDCLRKIANTFKKTLTRSSDLAARIGGEEFAVILPECDNNGAYCVAERIRSAIENLKIPHVYSTVLPYVTISIGHSSIIPSLDKDPRTAVAIADKALYLAKQSGRNRVHGLSNTSLI